MNRLILPEHAATEVRKQLFSSELETAGIVFAETTPVSDGSDRLLFREFLPAPDDAYSRRTSDYVELKPAFVAWALKRARVNSWSVFLTHTHPWQGTVRASTIDLSGEQVLRPTVFGRVPGVKHGRLIVGQSDYEAVLWSDIDDDGEPVRVVAVGSNYRELSKEVTGAKGDDRPFERQVRMLGLAGQKTLQSLRIGVVGLGGTGSIVAQQLAHLGIRDFLLIDPDTVEESNLNRLVGSTRRDVGKAKTEVAARVITAIQPSAAITDVRGSVLLNATAKLLLGTDLFFCCTDSHGSRAVLNQLAYQYYLPGFDIGVQVTAVAGRVKSVSGRVQMMSPSLSCLLCGSILDPEFVRRDLMTEFERQADPYIAGAHEPQPSVISLNSTVASFAVTMLLAAAVGFPLDARYQIYRADTGVVRSVINAADPECVVCSPSGALGRGDRWDLPGRQE
jgi:molybdopterin-synthase adenylyltransferase